MSDTGELVRVERVGNKSKKTKLDVTTTKLDFYTPSDPNKITLEHPSSKISSDSKSEQQKYSPRSETKQGVTAVMAVMVGLKGPRSSKKVSEKKTIRVLLDSGSDGDLLFHEKGNTQTIPLLD